MKDLIERMTRRNQSAMNQHGIDHALIWEGKQAIESLVAESAQKVARIAELEADARHNTEEFHRIGKVFEKERNELRAENERLNREVDGLNTAVLTSLEQWDAMSAELTEAEVQLAELGKQEPVGWANKAHLYSSKIAQERGGPYDCHHWSEGKTAFHAIPLYTEARPIPAQEDEVLCEEATAADMAIINKIAAGYPAQEVPQCTRSHPHELMDGYCELRTEIARLTNKLANLGAQGVPEDKRDAERYRWLRRDGLNTAGVVPYCVIGDAAWNNRPIELAELDAAIDAAIAAQKGELK